MKLRGEACEGGFEEVVFSCGDSARDEEQVGLEGLREGGVDYRRSAGRLLVPAAQNFGVALELAATASR